MFEQEARMKRLVIIATLSIAALSVAALTLAAPAIVAAQPAAQDQATRPAGDVNMDAVPTLNLDGVRKVQAALQKKGINPGPVDGIYGPLTKEAVRTFQDRYGIKATGEVDNQTLFALGEVDLAI
jgi:peptidoglycan hydrolase-like protein with peptidoglycan-binding domain